MNGVEWLWVVILPFMAVALGWPMACCGATPSSCATGVGDDADALADGLDYPSEPLDRRRDRGRPGCRGDLRRGGDARLAIGARGRICRITGCTQPTV